jgi:hypothetical protein
MEEIVFFRRVATIESVSRQSAVSVCVYVRVHVILRLVRS